VDFEPFVSADVVAVFLNLSRRRVLELARMKGGIPSHPLPGRGKDSRHTHRFLISEVAAWLQRRKG
jgi:hypothetical protein